MQCEIIYSSNKIGQLKSSVVVYLKTKNFDLFKSRLLRGSIPSETRFTLRYSDDLSEINKSVIEFYRDLQTITDRLAADNPDNIPTINQHLSQIETDFHIDADETQSASIESDLEVKTSQEEYDKNRNNLQEHLKEIQAGKLHRHACRQYMGNATTHPILWHCLPQQESHSIYRRKRLFYFRS